jgi:hypothetical protein
MIISVSRRTDIPAFFSDWFLSGFNNGRVTIPNPYRPDFKRVVSLRKEDVDAFVFWSRYPEPFFGCLDTIDQKKIPYYFMLTINHYPDFLEPHLVDLDIQLKSLKELSRRIGRSRIIWRYDPIIVSKDTDTTYHKNNFQTLAGLIAPYARRVIISFLDFYRKTSRNFKKIGFKPEEIRENPEKLSELLHSLFEIAGFYGLEIQSCAEDIPGSHFSIKRRKCIDDELLNTLFGLDIGYNKDPGQRKACKCQRSIDIGTYGSCRFKCIYCYAL